MNDEQIPRLGIDIGRVIIDGSALPGGDDTAFVQGDEQMMLATPEVDGAFTAISELVALFEGQVWLVSKCGERVRARSERWLRSHSFFEVTGVPQTNTRFCRTRPEKRGICVELGLTHFIDDRPEVHAAIQDVVRYQFFFGPQGQAVPDYGIHTADWETARRAILQSLGRSGG